MCSNIFKNLFKLKEALEILNMLILSSFAKCKMYILALSHLDDENLYIYSFIFILDFYVIL